MQKFLRFTALATLAAFLGLSALETFHSHAALKTNANCSVCQIASKTPALLSSSASAGPHCVSLRVLLPAASKPYIQFLFVAHGLSPPSL